VNPKKEWGDAVYELMSSAADAYGVCCISQRELASRLKTSKRSVNRAIGDLEEAGKITRVSVACYKILAHQVVPCGTSSIEVVPGGTSSEKKCPETRTSTTSEVVPPGTSSASSEEKQRIKEELDKYLIANGIKGERRDEEMRQVGDPHQNSPLPQTPSPVLDIYNIYNTGGERGVGREGGKHKFSDCRPPSVSVETWDRYMLARDEHPKAKQSQRAITALVNKINRFETQGQDPETMVLRAIEGGQEGRCWITVYPARRRESLVAGRSLPNLPYPLRDALNTASRGIPLSPKQEQVMVETQTRIGFNPRPGETWKEVAVRMIEKLDEGPGTGV
jgi:DNA-binding Lrp family transcriptional regulator